MKRGIKTFALSTLVAILYQIAFPTLSYALTAGPSQPESASFTPANVTEMVNTFTGDFSYNIPLLDVGGYPINISYQSGITMDQEASWVGLGWTLNPGSVNRQLRGLPDDFKGEEIIKSMNIKPNRTYGISIGAGVELVGLPIGLTKSNSFYYNNYKGFGLSRSAGASISAGTSSLGTLTAGLTLTKDTQEGTTTSFSASIGKSVRSEAGSLGLSVGIGGAISSRAGLKELTFTRGLSYSSPRGGLVSKGVSNTSYLSFASTTYTPSIQMPMLTTAYNYNATFGAAFIVVHPNVRYTGYASEVELASKRIKVPSYGYMYKHTREEGSFGLRDFNRMNDIPYSKKTPVLAFPVSTYDLFSVNGQGLNGQYRPFSGKVEVLFDHVSFIHSSNRNLGYEVGIGNLFKGGFNIDNTSINTTSSKWRLGNAMISYLQLNSISDPLYEPTYFKNVGDKVQVDTTFFSKIGDDNQLCPMITSVESVGRRISLYTKGFGYNGSIDPTGDIRRLTRDKRNSDFRVLTVKEAEAAGLDRAILSYPYNEVELNIDSVDHISRSDDMRRSNHISEISVLDDEGKRYVYGIPAYNCSQIEASFATDSIADDNGLIGYEILDASTSNSKGKDNFFNSEITPGYAHSYLLTGVLSPDYIDLTGNGITPDDNGDAIKINYTRVFGPGTSNGSYKWRMPVTQGTLKANGNNALLTNPRDNKGNYIYGTKEIWYTHTIESKTMVAQFVLEDRNDALPSFAEFGGIGTLKQKRLKEIRLYSKNDLINNDSAAVPIKTVHFEYSYQLCKGIHNTATPDSGKLTLTKIYFTYGKNNRGSLNPYVFTYSGVNKNYGYRNYDRWGNFSDSIADRSILTSDYPYTLQDRSKVDNWSYSWELTQILTPSGSTIKVYYESKDYAYVQDRQATQMFRIAGINNQPSSEGMQTGIANIYEGNTDYEYIIIDVPSFATLDNYYKKYFEGLENQIYFKCFTQIREKIGYEYISGFAYIAASGVISPTRIWVKLRSMNANKDFKAPAITKTAWDFIRLNMPHVAYPVAKDDKATILNAILSLTSKFSDIKDLVFGMDKRLKDQEMGKRINCDKSWIRLNNPDYNKLGGGCRVKKITYNDNWSAMVNVSGTKSSEYGYTYDYTTELVVDGEKKTISSGVAAWEPEVGGEENPHRLPINYRDDKPMAPSNDYHVDKPFGEALYPAPTIGYSKVTVAQIGNSSITRTAPGKTEYIYYTAKDFPTISAHTNIDKKNDRTESLFGGLLYSRTHDLMTVSQGYLVEVNDMHGKLNSVAEFNATGGVVKKTIYHYLEKIDETTGIRRIDNTIDVVNSSGKVITTEIGKDIDTWMDFREQETMISGTNTMINVESFFIFPPILVVLPPVIPKFSEEKTRFRSAVAVKFIQRFGILDRITVEESGSTVDTENLLFDAETGEVVLTRTTNEFNDSLYSFTYPAYWIYNNLGPTYKNNGLSCKVNSISSGVTSPSLSSYFSEGDELLIQPDNATEFRAWVSSVPGDSPLIIADSGIPVSSDEAIVKIIRSGRKNMSALSAGQVLLTSNPIKNSGGNRYIDFDDEDYNIIDISSTEYSDTWKINCERVPFVNAPDVICTDTITMECLADALNHIVCYFNITSDNPLLHTAGTDVSLADIVTTCGDSIKCSSIGGIPLSELTLFVDTPITEFYPHITFHLSDSLCLTFIKTNELDTVEITVENLDRYVFKDFGDCYLQMYDSDSARGPIALGFLHSCYNAIECIPEIKVGDIINPYVLGIKNNWHPVKTWSYHGMRNPENAIAHPRTSGYFKDNDFNFWTNNDGTAAFSKNGSIGSNWVMTNSVELMNRKGNELQNRNAINISSAALFGYEEYYPVAVSNNAEYADIANDNFEDYGYTHNTSAPCWMDHFSFRSLGSSGAIPVSLVSHSGYSSLAVTDTVADYVMRDIRGSENSDPVLGSIEGLWTLNNGCLPKFSPKRDKKYLLSVWAYSPQTCDDSLQNGQVKIAFNGPGGTTTQDFNPSGPIIEGWQMITGYFTVPSDSDFTQINVSLVNVNEVTYYDDFRIFPADASYKAFVYDPVSLRLMAELDDNNYALFYEYDAQGNLTRTKKETERGIMTVKEVKTYLGSQ